jgi:quinol monooxygenase YgiN
MAIVLHYAVEFTIKPGGFERFRELIRELTQAVEANEPKLLGYNWYFSSDQTKCHIVEWYADETGVQDHIDHVGGALAEVLEVSDITRFEVYGAASEATREILEPLGAQFFDLGAGFSRLD